MKVRLGSLWERSDFKLLHEVDSEPLGECSLLLGESASGLPEGGVLWLQCHQDSLDLLAGCIQNKWTLQLVLTAGTEVMTRTPLKQ